MPSPTLTFGFVLATLYGAGFHLMMGGGPHRLVAFLAAGWLGFSVGHIVGVLFDVTLFSIGAIRLLSASIVAGLALIFAHALTRQRPNARTSRTR